MLDEKLEESRIEKVREFFNQCPLLNKDNQIGIDFLRQTIEEYVIESTPVSQIIEKYITGSSKRQDIFIFASRESYGPDTLQNILNSRFYEKIVSWIEEQNDNDILPEIEGIESIEVLSTPYASKTSESTARYEFEFKIIYNVKGGKS